MSELCPPNTNGATAPAREQVKSAVPALAAAALRLRGKPGRPRVGGHVVGTLSPGTRMNTGDSHRAQARQANVPSRLLSVREAANYLGISTWTLRALVRAGAVPRVSLPGVRRLLFDREELDRVIERHLS